MTEHFTAMQAVMLAGITYRQLDYWTTNGYIKPRRNVGPNPGSGRQRSYTKREVNILCAMADLVRAGVDPHPAAKCARRIETKGYAYVGGMTLVSGRPAA